MQPDTASVAFLHATTGNQIKILCAMKLLGSAAHINQIAAIANINRNSVSEALSALAALGYTESADRYHWRLTATTTQLPLWAPTELNQTSDSNADAKILCIPLSSSSSLTRASLEETTTTTPPRDAKKVCVPPSPPVAALIALGATRPQAETAIACAHSAGLDVTTAHVAAWQRYVCDRPSINNPAALICARLTAGYIAPNIPSARRTDPSHMTAEERKNYYVPAGYEDLIEH